MIRKFALHSSGEKPTVDQRETLTVSSARKCDCLFHRSSLPCESAENVDGEKHCYFQCVCCFILDIT